MNEYLIPANSKRSQLIFNMFKPIDLIIFGTGLGVSLLLLFFIQDMSLGALIIKLLPVATCAFLCMPLPNYHNVRVFIRELSLFLINQRVYIWKGWCVPREYRDEK